MKGTELFKKTIKDYLDARAAQDELFAATYAKPNKSIDKCCDYIFQQVRNSGRCGFSDDEIYGMAVHYYDEDNIKDVPKSSMHVVVNHTVELTEDEKAEARRRAMDELQERYVREAADAKQQEAEKRKKAETAAAKLQTGSLFDL